MRLTGWDPGMGTYTVPFGEPSESGQCYFKWKWIEYYKSGTLNPEPGSEVKFEFLDSEDPNANVLVTLLITVSEDSLHLKLIDPRRAEDLQR